ncbi:hypothetical protein BJ968_002964 [Kineococcus aurantiacus]|uniref:Uncharacterized protein n=1 Tax=Kineococcus aurantiacus TaxID=37633 RepID=A0A7Y9J1T6_9ACTN|nr:hypothetical protein [Kineococcus aurantiacus]
MEHRDGELYQTFQGGEIWFSPGAGTAVYYY